MKRCFCVAGLLAVCLWLPQRSAAQAAELAQLALNIEKLSQLRKILTNLYDGYQILTNGYDRIKDIASGNYKIHQVFLDGLYAVNPEIKKYRRIADIVSYQGKIMSEYQRYLKHFRDADLFNAEDLAYLEAVYKNLLGDAAGNLEELLLVVTAGKARMSDDERLAAIDRIFSDMEGKLSFVRDFNKSTSLYALQKLRARGEVEGLRSLYGIK